VIEKPQGLFKIGDRAADRSTVERRDLSPDRPLRAQCRHCNEYQDLRSQRVEVDEGRVWCRCERCDEWFLIRWDDAVALGVAKPVADSSA
jgi:hypothetical protein